MEKKDLIPGGAAVHSLKIAALYPQRREERIAYALQDLLVTLPAVGTALVWPCMDRNLPWKVYYAGPDQERIRPWLVARLDSSFDVTLGVLQRDLCRLSDMPFPHLICLQPAPMFPAGLWIVWTTLTQLPREALYCLEEIRLTLEALIEVQSSEMHYFSGTSPLHDQALIEGLAQGDPSALSELLSMTRLVGHAEFAFWGRAYQDVVECTDHMGATQSGFGFAVPYGQGIGGRIAASGIPIMTVEDYRNSHYRHPSVYGVVDSEQVRSGIALPVRTRQGLGRNGQIAGVLYATHRAVKPFSLAEQLLVQRLTHLLEPLPPLTRPTSFLSPGLKLVSELQAAWYKLVLQANHIESLERWVGQYIQGTIIVTDSDGRPYVSARSKQLEGMRAADGSSMDDVQVISLEAPGVPLSGQIYLRSRIVLPPADWLDFFPDLIMACNLVIERMEQTSDSLARQREQWLHTVLQEKAPPYISQNGHQLGLPVEKGQIWVIAWPTEGQEQAARQRMLAENVVLDLLESPLLFLGDDIGVLLLDYHVQMEPSELCEALLTVFAPHDLWIVYGAYYHSLQDLKKVLTHSISLAKKARREAYSEYLLDVQSPGLMSQMVNPKLSKDLHRFATKQLTPLLEYDKSEGTDLTTTFVLAQTLGSVQAVSDELGIHVNTIRYWLRKAEDLLGIEEVTPKGASSGELPSSSG